MITIRKLRQLSKLILAVILLLCGSVFGQTRQEYSVPDFMGGLNLVTDSIDLAPNEAIQMDNFALDRFGALHKRYGIINWNDSLVSADTIKDIHYVENKNGDKMLFIATNNYVYEAKSWEDIDSMATWDSLNVNGTGTIIDYTAGSIDSIKDNYVYADTGSAEATDDSVSWMLSVRAGDLYLWSDSVNTVTEGDLFMIGDSTYTIDSVLSDFKLYLVSVTGVADTIGDANYRILKRVVGDPHLSSWNGNLYVALDQGEPWWYDGEEPRLLIYADTGYVTTATATVEGLIPWSPDSTVYLESNIVTAISFVFSATFSNGDSVKETGNYFEFDILVIGGRRGHPSTHHFESEIISVNSDTTELTLSRSIQNGDNYDPPIWFDPAPFYFINSDTLQDRRWGIRSRKQRVASDNKASIKDSTKNWTLNEWIGYYLVNGRDAFSRSYIYENNENTIWIDSSITINDNDKYYIAWATLNPDSTVELPAFPHVAYYNTEIYFSQTIFHRNRLYAIGEEITRKQHGVGPASYAFYGDTTNTNRVWFSDLALPNYIPSDNNFDLAGASRDVASVSVYSHDAAQAFFVLRDDLYVITNSNIYRISGEPNTDEIGYDLYISQVVKGVGTNQPNGIVTTKDNVAFIMNQQGIWYFDGNRIEKISYKVDPLVEKYRASRMTAGKFKDNLFFSYPDSNATIVMHYPTKGFTFWDIGMLTINDQAVAIDSNYFLFAQAEDSAYILKYPRDYTYYSDVLNPADTAVIVCHYRPGWMTFGTYRDKILEDIEITAYTVDGAVGWDYLNYLALYTNFTDTVRWSETAFSEGTPIHIFKNVGDSGVIIGKAYQIQVKDSTDNDFYLSNYRLRWYDPTK